MTGLASRTCAVALVAGLVAGSGVPGRASRAQTSDASAGVTVVRHCLIEYERSTPIGSPIFSTLQDCLVGPGDVVKAGQVLGRIQDEDLRAEVKLREAEASSDVEVRLSEARSARAQSKAARTATLVRRNAASQEEYNEHRIDAAAAGLEVEQARHKHKVAEIQLEYARAQLKARSLISPHDGVVTAVMKRKGEPVVPRDTVFQVVDTSALRVVGRVDVTEAWRLRVGRKVRVVAEVAGADLPVEREVFEGKLVFVDSQVDPVTRTCKIQVRAENRGDLLRAGLEARVEIDAESPAAGKPPAG